MTPSEWRHSLDLSLAALARELGVAGTNPARTLHRWEIGERVPPLSVMLEIERRSEGRVSISSWSQVRDAHRALATTASAA